MRELSEDIACVYVRYSITVSYPVKNNTDVLVKTTLEWDPSDQENEFIQLAVLDCSGIIPTNSQQRIQLHHLHFHHL